MAPKLSGKNHSNEGAMEEDGLADHSLDSAVDSEMVAKLSEKSASNNGSMERIDSAELSLHPAVDTGVAPWRVAKEMEQNQSELPFHFDTEFAGDALIQLGIENAVGTQVVSSVVTHDKSWRRIHDEGHEGNRSFMKVQKNKFGWHDDWNMPPDTKTINAQELAEQQKGRYRLPAPWRMTKSMEQNESELLFYIDTEFAGDALIEIGIESAAGTQIVNSVVRHDKSWRHIYKDGHDGTRMFMNLQQKKYGWDDDWKMPSSTETIDAQELATILLDSRANHPGARFIEFSKGKYGPEQNTQISAGQRGP